MYSTISLSPLDLRLDEKNPRFKISVNPSQIDIIEYLFENEKVLHLTSKIVDMDTVMPGERVVIFFENNIPIVLEGNRRVTVYKTLLDRTLVPTSFDRRFPKPSTKLLSEIGLISVDVVTSRIEAMTYLAARHIEGVEKWSSISKWRISYELYSEGKSFEEIAKYLVLSLQTVKSNVQKYSILRRGLDNGIWTEPEKTKFNLLKLKPDKLLRVFHMGGIFRNLGLYYDNMNVLKSTKMTDENLELIIVRLTRKAFIDCEIDTRSSEASVMSFINDLLPVQDDPTTEDEPPAGGEQPTGGGQYSGGEQPTGTGSTRNLPYFFTGLRYGHLSPNDAQTHGLTRIATEIQRFSNRQMVSNFPICAAYLTRALIEQSIKYYAKKTNIQAQQIKIWDEIVSHTQKKLQISDIIKIFIRRLPDFIPDDTIRSYFLANFDNYEDVADPLNWVVHKPDEFALHPLYLVNLPSSGLLTLINYFIK